MAYNTLQYRPHVTPAMQVMGLIGPSHCWHFDAWILQDQHGGALFVRIETRAGGRELLSRNDYALDGASLRYIGELSEQIAAIPVTLQDKALWPRFAELNALHWRYLYPMSLRVPNGFRSRSVALHYVRAPSLEPFDGTEANLHQYTLNATS